MANGRPILPIAPGQTRMSVKRRVGMAGIRVSESSFVFDALSRVFSYSSPACNLASRSTGHPGPVARSRANEHTLRPEAIAACKTGTSRIQARNGVALFPCVARIHLGAPQWWLRVERTCTYMGYYTSIWMFSICRLREAVYFEALSTSWDLVDWEPRSLYR